MENHTKSIYRWSILFKWNMITEYVMFVYAFCWFLNSPTHEIVFRMLIFSCMLYVCLGSMIIDQGHIAYYADVFLIHQYLFDDLYSNSKYKWLGVLLVFFAANFQNHYCPCRGMISSGEVNTLLVWLMPSPDCYFKN